MGLRRGRYAQTMLRTYAPYSDTGDIYGALALTNPAVKTDRIMRILGGLGGGLLLGSFLVTEKAKSKDFFGFGAAALGVSLFYFGAKSTGVNNG